LGEALLAGAVAWGPYHEFKVHDPKPRTIHAPRFHSRVAQHAIMNVCAPVFERYQLPESCASRPGKGTDDALARACRACRSGHWFLQMDVRRYFDSIDHATLRGLLRRRFKDRVVLGLFDSILDTFSVAPGKGVPIGNLTSQFFANHYLAVLDRHVKQTLGVRHYVRYMDDFVLWSTAKDEAVQARTSIREFLGRRLGLGLKVDVLNACERGMTFLGYHLVPGRLGLAPRTRRRFRRRARAYLRRYNEGEWDEVELARHVEPLLAFVRRGESHAFRRRCRLETGFGPEAPPACIAAAAGASASGAAFRRAGTGARPAAASRTSASVSSQLGRRAPGGRPEAGR
jgi:hypothetical protein